MQTKNFVLKGFFKIAGELALSDITRGILKKTLSKICARPEGARAN